MPAGDPDALAAAIVRLAAMDPGERDIMGKHGVEYVRQHHDNAVLAERFENEILNQNLAEAPQTG